jgi:hypothetical protein
MVPGIDTFRENLKIIRTIMQLLEELPVIFCCQRQTFLFVRQTTLI